MTGAPMKQQAQKQPAPEAVRDIDPNVQQARASRPDHSIWVTASAGTGKTKVLTDRVLRLLLPRGDAEEGTLPGRILCLTFTKAGAGEMALRLTKTLSRWAVMPTGELTEHLQKLLAHEPSRNDIAAARRLFSEVSDTPGGLKIMTIHSFCQSVLGRFPLEASIPPNFKPLEEDEANALLERARDDVIKTASPALERIARAVNEDQFFELIRAIVKEREQLKNITEKFGSIEGIYNELCEQTGVHPGQEGHDILKMACDSVDEPALRGACKALAASTGKKEPEWAIAMQDWLDSTGRVRKFDAWKSVFITTEGIARTSGFPTKEVEKRNPGLVEILRAESERLLQTINLKNAADGALLTRDLLLLGQKIIDRYQTLKAERAALDFDDLIFTTCALLEGKAAKLTGDMAAAWVLYKLDAGLDHILVDEAQDTNPEQWRIVEAITQEFATGLGARETDRTIFVVGDEKQSIYSFQRASRDLFEEKHGTLKEKIESAGKKWDDVPLNISFRSTKSVLQAVDNVFRNIQSGVSQTEVEHTSYRAGQAGRVELWPLFETEKQDKSDAWTLPTEIVESTDGASNLAAHIAAQVKQWIGKEELPARDRKVRPGDIMILFRTRNALFNKVTKALKDEGLPVTGADRMKLNDQIAVQDLMACASFALQPLDDLTLACILKSPLIGMSEADLFTLAHGREKQPLWLRVTENTPEPIKKYLDDIQHNAAAMRPFDFFTWLLQSPCPFDKASGLRALQTRLGPDIIDPVDELLNSILDFETLGLPSLQNFVQRQLRGEKEIKREMEEAGNAVRLMTVHGSKGLQAPIVILPDTVRIQRGVASKTDARLLWPDKTHLNVPLWSPRSEENYELYDQARAMLDQREDEEYRRLLYVAMTRAEDRLYLAGCKGTKNSNLKKWYDALREGLQSIENVETLEDGTLRLENPQTKDPDRADKKQKQSKTAGKIPAYLLAPSAPEKMPGAPLNPSKLDTEEPAINSPLQPGNPHRFRRGILTHKLLEFLPNLAPEKHTEAAKNFLEHFAADIPPEMRAGIAKETLAILTDAKFAAVFGSGSLAEIPVTGKMADGRIVSGQIDRLLITADEILIVDYKTNRPPPLDEKDVPAVYKSQMHAYREVLSRIYPGRTVSCALLWTDGPRLMLLTT